MEEQKTYIVKVKLIMPGDGGWITNEMFFGGFAERPEAESLVTMLARRDNVASATISFSDETPPDYTEAGMKA